MKLPLGAELILQSRLGGQRPADAVIVSCVGSVREANPTVVVTAARHDWRFLKDLEVYVFVGPNSRFVPQTLRAIARHAADIVVWDVEAKAGANLLPVWRYDERTWKPSRFVRWARMTWTKTENARFAKCA